MIINFSIPCVKFPSPKAFNPKTGISIPPAISPIPLIVSETATAFKPPNIAYIPPMIPIPHIVRTRAACSDIPNIADTLNREFKATPPEYNTTGRKIIPRLIKNRIATIFLVPLSYLSSRN